MTAVPTAERAKFEAWQAAKAELAAEVTPAVARAKELLGELGVDCDHSVGICRHADNVVLDMAAEALGRLGQ